VICGRCGLPEAAAAAEEEGADVAAELK